MAKVPERTPDQTTNRISHKFLQSDEILILERALGLRKWLKVDSWILTYCVKKPISAIFYRTDPLKDLDDSKLILNLFK